ncbi:hypothetical protein BD626DRAFT_48892 [Schizophyllum amplum]|uniref:Uncharacterized protein n=1 Tax=Schizophyllum amplum TaxID=97359 RepID=A0A550BSM7_9AGAR|nr:hypothetical protein BD626DRAFT_48892 [Auriculariopsis ampla]
MHALDGPELQPRAQCSKTNPLNAAAPPNLPPFRKSISTPDLRRLERLFAWGIRVGGMGWLRASAPAFSPSSTSSRRPSLAAILSPPLSCSPPPPPPRLRLSLGLLHTVLDIVEPDADLRWMTRTSSSSTWTSSSPWHRVVKFAHAPRRRVLHDIALLARFVGVFLLGSNTPCLGPCRC